MMKPLYDQIFNQQYVNPDYLLQLQQQQHHNQQQQEIAKAVKALLDLLWCSEEDRAGV